MSTSGGHIRHWAKPTNPAKFKIKQQVRPHLIDVNNDEGLTPDSVLTIKDIYSSGMPKRTKYVVEESDFVFPESRLKAKK